MGLIWSGSEKNGDSVDSSTIKNVDDLYGAVGNNKSLRKMDVAEMTPSKMVVNDMRNENSVRQQTQSLRNSLAHCEQIVIAAYQVAEYVPDLSNDKHSKFWKDDVIPNLIESLKQYLQARATINKALISVHDLGIKIQMAGELVIETRGGKKAIEIAQENIPDALKILDNCIKMVELIEITAIEKFGEQTNKIFQIIGPKAVDYVDQKVEILVKLNELYENQQKIITEIGEKQGEVIGLDHMINATEKQYLGANEDLEVSKSRTAQLAQLNSDVENSIKSIPAFTVKHVTNNTNKNFVFWRSNTTSNHTEMVKNQNREADKIYYESIVLSRMSRIRENRTDEASKLKVMDDLNKSLSELKAKSEKARKELDELHKTLPDRMKILQDQIDKYVKEIEEIDKNQVNVANMIGLHGNKLIECLIHVRTFAKSIQGGVSAYAPFAFILSGIKAMVLADVKLLSSNEPADIFLAGNRLMKQVEFLLGYSAKANEILEPSSVFSSLANTIEFKTMASITD